jgi:hypothetical protein
MGFRNLAKGGNPPAIYPVFRLDRLECLSETEAKAEPVNISPFE